MNIRNHILIASTCLVASVPAAAQSKQALQREFNALGQSLQRAGASDPSAFAAMKTRFHELRVILAGGPATTVAVAPTSLSGPAFIVAPSYNTPGPCGALEVGSPGNTLSFASAPALAIVDNAVVSDTLVVSGLGAQIFDVDLTVAITHTWAADVSITLTSPAGTAVDVSSGNGGNNDDVYNGTLFDDESINPVTTYVFTNGVAAPDLKPETSINDSLRGEDPNGLWTLSIGDNASGDVGVLNSWSLSVTDGTVLSIPPSFGAPTTFSTGPIAVGIVDNATVSAPLTVTGGPTSIVSVKAYVEITHTWSADMLIELESPALTKVVLSNRRGGSNDDVFNGTLFDMGSSNLIGSYAFSNAVVAPDLRPDGNLNDFAGEDANGTWNLIVNDNANGDVGTIGRWDLILVECSGGASSYCTSGTSLAGCVPSMSATGSASVSAPSGFVVSVNNVDGQRFGQIYYGITGPASIPFGAGYLCVAAPRQRMGQASFTGGTSGLCDGGFSADLQLFAASHPSALGVPLTAGTTVFFQGTARDNGNLKNRVMTDALTITLTP